MCSWRYRLNWNVSASEVWINLKCIYSFLRIESRQSKKIDLIFLKNKMSSLILNKNIVLNQFF
jgi:hypothetical protein